MMRSATSRSESLRRADGDRANGEERLPAASSLALVRVGVRVRIRVRVRSEEDLGGGVLVAPRVRFRVRLRVRARARVRARVRVRVTLVWAFSSRGASVIGTESCGLSLSAKPCVVSSSAFERGP